jgi:ABC-type multidrug transport system ATPase subunit
MRRVLLAVVAGGLLLSGAACGSDAKNGSDEAQAPTFVDPTSAAPVVTEPDYSANTKQVCTRLTTIYQGELADFGTAMGKLITYREAKQTAEAKKAANTAAAELKAVAVKIRKETGAAQDPELKDAGVTSAVKLETSAKDRKYITKVKTLKDLNKTIEGQLTEWLTPVAGYCG